MQQLTIVGRLGKDAIKGVTNGQTYINISVAVDTGFYGPKGEWVDRTNWWKGTIWRDASIDRLKKGAIVLVQGTPDQKIYQDESGVSKIDLRLKVDTWRILVKSSSDTASNTQNSENAKPQTNDQPQVPSGGEIF